MNKKDTFRNYAIWAVLIVFYGVFYFVNNRAWVDEIDLDGLSKVSTTEVASTPLYYSDQDSIRRDTSSTHSHFTDHSRSQSGKQYKSTHRYTGANQTSIWKKININTATIEDWESLYNIGPFRADRIVNFRKALGGFYSIAQVGETYGLPDSVFQEIKPQLSLDSTWNRILINEIVYDSLYPHPYVTKQMAYYIVRHRENKHQIEEMQDLYDLIEDKDHERLRKLEPYVDFGIK